MLAHASLPKMVRIPAGLFTMGSDGGGVDERPAHVVELDAFHLSAHPITNALYEAFVRDTSRHAPGVHELPLIATLGGRDGERAFRQMCAGYVWSDGRPPNQRRTHPVTLVRWNDAEAFCQWLAEGTGHPVRLPTEAEWERAARGSGTAEYPTGDAIDTTRANYLDAPSLKRARGTKTVGSYPPNQEGLHDLAGNVWEWVADWYDESYYAQSPRRNPHGPSDGRFRVVRGGGWVASDPSALRCGSRHRVPVDTYAYSIGFRIAY